ncbi:hypothetical protein L1049_018925 [Liquidambar formosana]|uniref:Dynein light chain n=1 Tax=Liquidambar formosana TaxID=63359 RepID=A0AAP0RBR2_LIQFO
MLEGKAVVEDTDMPLKMQAQAMASASQALDLYDVLDCESIAAHIKIIFLRLHSDLQMCTVSVDSSAFPISYLIRLKLSSSAVSSREKVAPGPS